jgi:protein-disulfide isomerase
MSEQPSSGGLSLPGAIVVGAIIIAIAILITFTGARDKKTSVPTPESAQLSIAEAAKKTRVNLNDLEACLESDEQLPQVTADSDNAIATGGTGTPHSIIITPNGTPVSVGGGALPRESWDEIIDLLLDENFTLPEGLEDPAINVAPVTEADYIRGNINAPITIIEYSDIDCPFCHRLHATLKQLVEDRPEDVRWVYRHFPLTSLHPEARDKAEATECVAAIKGKEVFWEYLDLLTIGQ